MGNSHNLPESSPKQTNIKYKKPSDLILTTLTWTRDSHGLFDYECSKLAKKSFKAQSTGFVRRTANDIGFTKDNTNKQGDQDLLKLSIKEGSFWISGCNEQEPKNTDKDKTIIKDSGNMENDPWLVVRSYKANTNKGFKLNEGDLIKLGRVKFRIRELRESGSAQVNSPTHHEKHIVNTEIDNNLSNDESFKKSPRLPKGSLSSVGQLCRICLSDTCEADDPFIYPCQCSGTMKFIHLKCLQTWLKSKIHTKVTGNTTFVFWKTLECELCKTPYPQTLDQDNKKYDIVEFEKPDCAYIALEVISKDKNVTRGVHIVKLEGKNNIRLGRGHDADIRITDISVSRCHALIKLEKGNFYLDDNNSKFGTLVHIPKALPIQGEFSNIAVQVGRSLITISSKKSSKTSCFGFMHKSSVVKKAENGLISDMTRTEFNLFEAANVININQVENESPVNIDQDRDNQNRSDISDEQNNSEVAVPAQVEQIEAAEPQAIVNPQNVEVILQPIIPAVDVESEDEEGNLGSEGNERSFRNYIVI